ncbi:CPBP family intramembrane glutamic endopeptidase [Neobacillus massiliamazoniensis]|jgi:membrane protease YdiL (CAAX protease family)|uniref:Abortive infection protein n=1 Tax=Neobacillus massiliamazoniensis TaxID=1499688 RepID=A0A0U1NSH9_9BACI|nr:CPBP family intramembrane glutamic endopeptidase [Neobacillus massiliamazoniensis]CRK80678.1 abortive infection protein [Neobacillus massiliamazoniensis]
MKRLFDLRLIFGIIIAHLLLNFSFQDKSIFWYIFSGSVLVLITFSMLQGEVEDRASFFQYILFGVVSGCLLYLIFWLGYHAIGILQPAFRHSVRNLYNWYAPSQYWQYLALVLIAAPGEELFWRGFVQKRLSILGPLSSIVIASLLYASVNIYSGSFLLILSTFAAGLFWGALYWWKRSMPLIIVSHIVFDILLFIIMPLK